MQEQKCRVCEQRHPLGPCPLPKRAAEKIAEGLTEALEIARGTALPLRTVTLAQPPKKRAPRGTFDRNAYQRELMRKRRAAQKPS